MGNIGIWLEMFMDWYIKTFCSYYMDFNILIIYLQL